LRRATGPFQIGPSKQIIGGVVQTWSGAMRIYKLPTHDGNYTVYRNGEVLCCGLTRTAADALIIALCCHAAHQG
jgi:hypothetical protein